MKRVKVKNQLSSSKLAEKHRSVGMKVFKDFKICFILKKTSFNPDSLAAHSQLLLVIQNGAAKRGRKLLSDY